MRSRSALLVFVLIAMLLSWFASGVTPGGLAVDDPPPNQAPTVDAGPDTSTPLMDPVTLAGSASDDGLPEGSTLTTTWSKVSGLGTVSFADASSPQTTATFSVGGVYVLQLSATDGDLTSTDTTLVSVEFQPCTEHCDCPQGQFCYNGNCIQDAEQDVYCCAKSGCPPGAWCIALDGTKDRCPEDPTYNCDTACDCGPAHCCNDSTCVKDVGDPWLPGGTQEGPPCVRGEDATYCASDPACFAGFQAYRSAGLSAEFRCYGPFGDEVRGFCGAPPCLFSGDCFRGQSCVYTRGDLVPEPPPGALGSPEGGACVSNASAEAVFGWKPSDLLPPCATATTPGTKCEAGWRPGDSYSIERVVDEFGSCGNGTCEFELGETSTNCTADCACGDGFCDTSEVGSCADDCGSGQPVMPLEWSAPSACGDGVCQQTGVIPENCINCWLDCDAVTDTDGDGTPDGCDLCATDPAKTEPGACGCGVVDTDWDSDGLADCVDPCPLDPLNDADGDGLCGDIDLCPGTQLPDDPTDGLRGARFAANTAGIFDSGLDRFDGMYTLEDTHGCSAAQIISLEVLGGGHTKFGISKSALEAFIAGPNG